MYARAQGLPSAPIAHPTLPAARPHSCTALFHAPHLLAQRLA